MNDIAPTLANTLDVESPSGSVGRVLDDAPEKAEHPARRPFLIFPAWITLGS